MPFADLSKFEKNPEVSHISDLFTVEMITRYIQGKLGPERRRRIEEDVDQPRTAQRERCDSCAPPVGSRLN